jgi:hypothetical protein
MDENGTQRVHTLSQKLREQENGPTNCQNAVAVRWDNRDQHWKNLHPVLHGYDCEPSMKLRRKNGYKSK